MATRLGQDEREISVRLAQVTGAQPLSMPPREVVINVTDKGDYVVIGQTLDEPALAGFLHDVSIRTRARRPCKSAPTTACRFAIRPASWDSARWRSSGITAR